MRIITINANLELAAGTEQAQLRIMRELKRMGDDVILVYGCPGRLLEDWQGIASSIYHLSSQSVLRSIMGYFRLRSDLASMHTQEEVVYIHHSGHWYNLLIGMFLSRSLSVPLVIHIHLPYGGHYRLHKLMLKTLSNLCADVFYVSNSTQQQWRDAGFAPKFFKVIPNGVDCDVFVPATSAARASSRSKLGIDPNAFIMAAIGRLTREKGIVELCEAWKQICANMPDWNAGLLLVGTAPLDVEKVIGAIPNSRHLPWIDAIQDVYSALDLVVVPSVWEEPYALVLVEALASGVPIIASDVGGIRETLGDWAEIYPQTIVRGGNVDDLVRAIAYFKTLSQQDYYAMREYARRYASSNRSIKQTTYILKRRLQETLLRHAESAR